MEKTSNQQENAVEVNDDRTAEQRANAACNDLFGIGDCITL